MTIYCRRQQQTQSLWPFQGVLQLNQIPDMISCIFWVASMLITGSLIYCETLLNSLIGLHCCLQDVAQNVWLLRCLSSHDFATPFQLLDISRHRGETQKKVEILIQPVYDLLKPRLKYTLIILTQASPVAVAPYGQWTYVFPALDIYCYSGCWESPFFE